MLRLFFLLLLVAVTAALENDERLYKRLFENYVSDVAPKPNASTPVVVSMEFSVYHMENLDEKEQSCTTYGFADMYWRDYRLSWNISEYNGLEEIMLPARSVWTPDISLDNGIEEVVDEKLKNNFQVIVTSEGDVQWSPGGIFKTQCPMDITKLPFDTQKCEIKFACWTSSGSHVLLINETSEVYLDGYKGTAQWEIIGTSSTGGSVYYESSPGVPYPYVTFSITLKRKPKYYIMNIVVPTILISLVALMVFLMPPETGEKVGLGITVMLSFSVFLLILNENMPKTSDATPLIGTYVTLVMGVTTCSIVTTIVVLNVFYKHPRPPPKILRVIFLDWLGPLVCHTCKNDRDQKMTDAVDLEMKSHDIDSSLGKEMDEYSTPLKAAKGEKLHNCTGDIKKGNDRVVENGLNGRDSELGVHTIAIDDANDDPPQENIHTGQKQAETNEEHHGEKVCNGNANHGYQASPEHNIPNQAAGTRDKLNVANYRDDNEMQNRDDLKENLKSDNAATEHSMAVSQEGKENPNNGRFLKNEQSDSYRRRFNHKMPYDDTLSTGFPSASRGNTLTKSKRKSMRNRMEDTLSIASIPFAIEAATKYNDHNSPYSEQALAELVKYMRTIAKKHIGEEQQVTWTNDWQDISIVMDRILFIFFAIVILCTILSFVYIIPEFYM